ncbi:MAG: MotA/TolQ/ExbB proton channel family protein [Sphingobacteriia bacterium]|nr:MotA/TolQ/ExbB proton channel family protein [Sphingobacteriia bacterium]
MNETSTDLTSFFGIVFCIALIFAAIIVGGNVLSFLDAQSVLIVVGGTFCVTSACFKWDEIIASIKISLKTVFYTINDLTDSAYFCIKCSERAYKKGVLDLANQEREIYNFNPFLWEGVKLVSDSVAMDFLDHNLTQHLIFMVERHKKTVAILKKAGEIAPAMGLIGTLVGLVQMLNNLNDISKIGPAMAVALLTTFYGAIISYVFMFPLASKLERNTQEELILNKLFYETIISIAKKQNPRLLEITLNNILPHDKKVHYFDNK